MKSSAVAPDRSPSLQDTTNLVSAQMAVHVHTFEVDRPPYGLLIGQQHQRLPDRPKKYPPEAI